MFLGVIVVNDHQPATRQANQRQGQISQEVQTRPTLTTVGQFSFAWNSIVSTVTANPTSIPYPKKLSKIFTQAYFGRST
ncbi:hypothetical protein ANTQUA_LOCUS1381 [Anthophora quadrimaculata]